MFASLTVARTTILVVYSLLLIMVYSSKHALMSTVKMRAGKNEFSQSQLKLFNTTIFIELGVQQKWMLQTMSSLASGDIAPKNVDTVLAPLLVSGPTDHVDMTVSWILTKFRFCIKFLNGLVLFIFYLRIHYTFPLSAEIFHMKQTFSGKLLVNSR